MDAKIVVAFGCKATRPPSRLQGRQCEDVLNRHAELVGSFLRVGEMRVDKAFLLGLNVARLRCRRPNVGILAPPALITVIGPLATIGVAGGVARLVRPVWIVLLQGRCVRQLGHGFGCDLWEGEQHRVDPRPCTLPAVSSRAMRARPRRQRSISSGADP